MNAAVDKKVLMIGLDSADSEYLLAYLPHLPNLNRLVGDGRFLNLDTTATDMDATVWPTFYLGKLPGDHGLYFPFQWNPADMRYRRINKLDWLKYEPFWQRLADAGVKVGLLDIMMVPVPLQPTRNIHQYFWQTQDEGDPDSFNRCANWPQAKRLFGTNKLGWDISADMTGGQRKILHDRLLESAQTRGRLTRWLLDHTDWDLFIASFSEIHRAGHYFCHDPSRPDIQPDEDLLLSCYKKTDTAIGHILEGIDHENTHVIVFSLSGMGPNNSQSHFLTEVLERFNKQYTGTQGALQPAGAKMAIMRRLREILPGPLQVEISSRVSHDLRDWVVNRAYTGGIKWDRTLAFHALSGGQGYIRWNMQGRERAGILASDGAEINRYSKALKEELLSLEAVVNGRKIVKRLVDIPSVYPGPYAKYLPDISVIWENMAPVTEIVSPRLGKFKGRIGTGRGGNHRDTAFILTSVPESGERTDPGHIVELARYIESLLT